MRFTGFLAVIWGIFWALFLQFVPLGRFLAGQRTWITVVIGIGVDLLLARRVMDSHQWWRVVFIIFCSSLPIIGRSLINEFGEVREFINDQLRRQQPTY